MTTNEIVYTMERDLAATVRRLADTKRRALVPVSHAARQAPKASGTVVTNKLSATIALFLIAIGVLIAAISKASSPATNPPVLFCGLLIECGIG
jgi:hypothetical protein